MRRPCGGRECGSFSKDLKGPWVGITCGQKLGWEGGGSTRQKVVRPRSRQSRRLRDGGPASPWNLPGFLVLVFLPQILPSLAWPGPSLVRTKHCVFKPPESHEYTENCLLPWGAAPDHSGPSSPIPWLEGEVGITLIWAHTALTPAPQENAEQEPWATPTYLVFLGDFWIGPLSGWGSLVSKIDCLF